MNEPWRFVSAHFILLYQLFLTCALSSSSVEFHLQSREVANVLEHVRCLSRPSSIGRIALVVRVVVFTAVTAIGVGVVTVVMRVLTPVASRWAQTITYQRWYTCTHGYGRVDR